MKKKIRLGHRIGFGSFTLSNVEYCTYVATLTQRPVAATKVLGDEKTARVVVHILQLAFENVGNVLFHLSFTTLNILYMNIFQTNNYTSSA